MPNEYGDMKGKKERATKTPKHVFLNIVHSILASCRIFPSSMLNLVVLNVACKKAYILEVFLHQTEKSNNNSNNKGKE